MNEDENLIAEIENIAGIWDSDLPYHIALMKAAKRLRELTAVPIITHQEASECEVPEGSYRTGTPPCDAARALSVTIITELKGQPQQWPRYVSWIETLIQSALTARAEEVRERCAKVADEWEYGREAAREIRTLDLTEAGK